MASGRLKAALPDWIIVPRDVRKGFVGRYATRPFSHRTLIICHSYTCMEDILEQEGIWAAQTVCQRSPRTPKGAQGLPWRLLFASTGSRHVADTCKQLLSLSASTFNVQCESIEATTRLFAAIDCCSPCRRRPPSGLGYSLCSILGCGN